MNLIKESLNNRLNGLVGHCFHLNRILDRDVSLLNIRFKLPNTAEVLHYKAAHIYLGEDFADAIANYQGLRNNETVYPATVEGSDNPPTVLSVFSRFHEENLTFESMINDAIDEAEEIGDFTTKNFLNKLLNNLSEMTNLSQRFVDIFEDCNNDKFKMLVIDTKIKDYIQ